ALFIKDNELHMINLRTFTDIYYLTSPVFYNCKLAVSKDGRYALTNDNQGQLYYWDLEKGVEVRRFKGKISLSLKLSMDGKIAISGDNLGSINLYEIGTGRELNSHTFGSRDFNITNLSYLQEKNLVLFSGVNTTSSEAQSFPFGFLIH